MGGGPDKTILMGSVLLDPKEFSTVVCYLRDAQDSACAVADRARALGVDYVEILERRSFDWKIWPQLCRIVSRCAIDIIHSHDYKTDALALVVAQRMRVIPIATAHGWILNSWREYAYNAADIQLLRRFPAVIAVSRAIKATLTRAGARPERLHHIPNGVDHKSFRKMPDVRCQVRRELGLASGAFVIGVVGRLSQEKRVDVLLDAVAALQGIRPSVLLVGEGLERDALLSQARSLGIAERLRVTGYRSDIPAVLQAFDLYVQTSDTEGVPNAVLEAMAAEVPVIATDVGGTSEILEDERDGLLVPAGNVPVITKAIERAVDDWAATELRARNARSRVERELSFQGRMRRVEAVYRSLLGRRVGSLCA